jgi:two-component system, OmpR family, phosphate regulon sensor histidine kinase PhoR
MMNKVRSSPREDTSMAAPFWDFAENPFFLLNQEGEIIDSNQAALSTFGDSRQPMFPSLFQEEKKVRDAIKQCLVAQQPITLEKITTIDNASAVQIGLCLSNQKDLNRLIASVKNIPTPLDALQETARLTDEQVEKLSRQLKKVSEELLVKTWQLAEEKNKLATIINGVSEGLLGCNDKGVIIHSNKTAKALLRITDDDVASKTFPEICPDIATTLGLKKDAPFWLAVQRVNVTVHEKEIQIFASPIDDEQGCPIGFVLIIHDRTKEAQLDNMKSDLISIVSHELRSPLTSIKGYIDLMMAGDFGEIPKTMSGYLNIISSNANRLAALIDDMLDLSRIESGKLTMTFGKVDVKYLCDYVFLTMKLQAEQKSIEFISTVQEGLAVSGDVDRLQQVITNLVSNAIKYTPEQGRIEMAATRIKNKIHITLTDNGLGICEEDQRRLFHKFFRVKNEKTRNIGGTGLGLCIAKSITEAHDGRILVQSAEGQGSCFTLELPEYHP